MRIIFFSSFFYPHVGGVESYVANLAKCLAENPSNKIIVVACNTNNSPAQEKLAKFTVVRLDCWSFFAGRFPILKPTKYNWTVLGKIFTAKADFWVTSVRFYPLTLLAVLAVKFLQTRHIHIEHSSAPLMLGNKILGLSFRIYDFFVGTLVLFLSGKVTGSSRSAMNFTRSKGARSLSNFIAYNGVNLAEFNFGATKRHPQRILFVGRLVYSKGCSDLIEAFDKITDQFPRAELWVAGDGPERSKLAEKAQFLRVKFLGELDRKQVISAYRSSSIFVLPSYSESAPTTLLEAGAAGLNIVATKIPGITEIFKHKDNLFMPGDVGALAKILKNNLQNPSHKIAKEFQRKVEQDFDWKILAQKFENFLKN